MDGLPSLAIESFKAFYGLRREATREATEHIDVLSEANRCMIPSSFVHLGSLLPTEFLQIEIVNIFIVLLRMATCEINSLVFVECESEIHGTIV